MNVFTLSLIQGFSIGIAVIIGLVRFRHIAKPYRPFIYLCCIALANEIFSTYAAHKLGSNAVNANVYVLIEAVFFAWLFRNWKLLQKKSWHFPVFIAVLVLVWVIDNLIWHKITIFNSLFRIYYSFCLIFLAITYTNILLVRSRGSLLKNAEFLICTGILIYYSYKATMEVFYLLELKFSPSFYINLHSILAMINLFVNLIYAWAVLWMPKKQKFILPY